MAYECKQTKKNKTILFNVFFMLPQAVGSGSGSGSSDNHKWLIYLIFYLFPIFKSWNLRDILKEDLCPHNRWKPN